MAGALIGLFAFLYSPLAPRASVAALDAFALLVGLALPLGGAVLGWFYAAPKGLSGASRLAISLIGFVHGVVQVTTPLVCARLVPAGWLSLLAGVGALLLAWASLLCSRGLFRGRLASLLVVVALASWCVTLVSLHWATPAGYTVPHGAWGCIGQLAAPFLAAFLGTTYFTFYLAIVGALNGHWNEVGGAARVIAFRQFIRFHLTKDGLRGYTIAVEQKGPAATAGSLEFRLIDVFSIKA